MVWQILIVALLSVGSTTVLVRPIRSTLFYFYFTQVSYIHLMQLNDPMCLPAFIFMASPPYIVL